MVELPLVHTTKTRTDFQDDVLLAIPDLIGFPKMLPSTTCHEPWCELLLTEQLPSRATIINS